MSTELKPFPIFKEARQKPISFAVSEMPTSSAALALAGEQRVARVSPTEALSGQRSQPEISLYPLVQSDPVHPHQQAQRSGHRSLQMPGLPSYPLSQVSLQVPDPAPVLVPQKVARNIPAKPATHRKLAVKPKEKAAHRVRSGQLVRSIGAIKWGSTAIASILVAGAFAAYGWTVSLEQRGSELNKALQTSRSHEEGMRGMGAALSANIVEDASSPSSGLSYPDPRGNILLEPESPRPLISDSSNIEQHRPNTNHQPRGY